MKNKKKKNEDGKTEVNCKMAELRKMVLEMI